MNPIHYYTIEHIPVLQKLIYVKKETRDVIISSTALQELWLPKTCIAYRLPQAFSFWTLKIFTNKLMTDITT